jgi:hypothetical protein
MKRQRPKSKSQTGSQALLRHRALQLQARNQVFERNTRAYRRALRKLFSKADLRVAQDIVTRGRREWHRSNLDLGMDSSQWDAAKDVWRRRINRQLARALPGFREWRQLRQAHGREYQRLVGLDRLAMADRGVHIDLDDVLPSDWDDMRLFVAPYAVTELGEDSDTDVRIEDRSFVDSSLGEFAVDLRFVQDDDGPLWIDIYGINWPSVYARWAGCGVNFTMPRAGRLHVNAALRNLASPMTYVARDRFGLSEAQLEVYILLRLWIFQGNSVIEMSRTLATNGLSSHGTDLAASFVELDTSSLYIMDATTEEVFEAGTGLQVVIGCELQIHCEIDDMTVRVDALLSWRLEGIAIGVREP